MNKSAFLLIIAALLVLLSSGSVCAVLDDAIRYYSIDDTDRTGNIVYDLAGNSNATNTGLTLGVTGIISEGAEGSGASGDYHIAYSSPADSSWSLSVWFKADTIANDMIWSSTVTADQYFQLVDNTHIDFYIGTSNNLAVSSLGTTWHHVVMTMDSCNAIIYLDNVNIDNQTYTSDCSLGAEAYWLADWNGGAGYELDGKIDEFALYDRVLTSSEVSTLYNSGNGYNPYHQVPTQPPIFTIYPETAYTADDLYADFTSTDPDNDTIVFNWNWSNGTTEAIRFIDDGSLVSYYAMDDTEASTVYDYSGSNDGTMSGYTQNNGVRNGGVEISTDDGKYGYGGGFDGVDDYISFNDIILNKESATISFWVKPNVLGVAEIIVGNSDTASESTVSFSGTSGRIFLETDSSGNTFTINTGHYITDYNWHHIVAVFNGSYGYGYQDGINTQGAVSLLGNLTLNQMAHIGHIFNGSIDEVRIWNKALTQTEIQAEMNSPNPVKGDGLVASYSFEQHNSTHALDTNHLVKGEIAEGITFDGVDDYINVPNTPMNYNKTISFWYFNRNTLSTKPIIDFSSIHKPMIIASSTKKMLFYNDAGHYLYSTTLFDSNTWYHIVIDWTYDISNAHIYVNGLIDDGTRSGTGEGGNVFNDFDIGRYTNGAAYFNGSIDEVQIYNRSLSESEIKALYEGSRHYSNGTHAELDSSFTSTFDTWTLDVTPYDYTAGGTLREVYAYINSPPPALTWLRQDELNMTVENNPTYLFNITYANLTSVIFYHGLNDTYLNSMNLSYRYPASAKQPDRLRACNRNESIDLIENNAIKLYEGDIVSYGGHLYGTCSKPVVYSSESDWAAFNMTFDYHHMMEQHIPIDKTALHNEVKTDQYIDIYKSHPAIVQLETFPVDRVNLTIHIELNIDDKNGTYPLLMYGCNSSVNPYTVDYTSDSNCAFYGTRTDFDTKDRISNQSSYVHFHAGIDENGKVGGTSLTPSDTMFMYLDSDAPNVAKGFKLYYANNTVADNTNFDETYYLHTYSPSSWTNRSETPDVQFEITADEYDVQYYVFACNSNPEADCVNFTIQTDALGERPNEAPNAPYLIQPLVDYNISGTYNITWLDGVDPEGDDFNITLILINHTDESEYVLTSTIPKGTGYYSWDTTSYIDLNTYQIVIYATDSGGLSSLNDTSKGNFTIDNTAPTITINPSNAFTATNISTIDNYKSTEFPLNITFDDNRDLFAMEINITNSTGHTVFNRTNTSLSGLTYNYTETVNNSNWTVGLYNIEVIVSDSHTASKIGSYEPIRQTDKLVFNTKEKNLVIIEADDAINSDAIKKYDRYQFEFRYPKTKTTDIVYHIKSYSKIYYRPDSGYKAHFIIWNEKTKTGNWIDFEDVALKDYSVKKISDNDYTVTF